MTLISVSSENRPLVIGVATALCFHALLLTLFTMMHLDVAPMTTPPLEVELLGVLSALDEKPPLDVPDTPPSHVPDLPAIRTDPIPPGTGETDVEEPVPNLPQTGLTSEESQVPPPLSSIPPREPPSPRERLSPIPLASQDSALAPEARVRVKVEGMLRARRLVHLVDPIFPPEAHRGGIVRVRLVVAPDGTVTLATVVQKAQPSLEHAALDALKQWRFAESRSGEASQGIVTVDFVVQ